MLSQAGLNQGGKIKNILKHSKTLLTAGVLAFGLTGAAAASSFTDWLNQPTMTGDWGGVRTSLKDMGITPFAYTLDEFAQVFSGGTSNGGTVAAQVGAGADFDMGKLFGLKGGTFHFALNYRSGQSASIVHGAGNLLEVQSNYGAGQNFRLSRLAYSQKLDGGAINLSAGFFPVGDDFDNFVVPLCAFENFAFCGHANPIFYNSGDSVYPTGHWGGDVRVYPIKTLYVEGGVWAVNPKYLLPTHGFDMSLRNATGAVIPVEIGFNPQIGPEHLPGQYKIGGYYDSSTVNDPAYPTIKRHGRYGGYIMASQMVYRFHEGSARGLTLFGEFIIGDQRTSSIPRFFNVGFIVQGPLASRPKDYFDVGVGYGAVNNRIRRERESVAILPSSTSTFGQLGESAVEVGYGIQATNWLIINPNIQFIGNPGAFTYKKVSNAWYFGTQLLAKF